MAKIVCLFAFVAFLQVATALKCYSCDSNQCPDQSKWQEVPNCGNTITSQSTAGACLKEVYTDKAGKELTERRCIIAEKSADGKISHKCEGREGKVISCEVCNNDLCNSAPAVGFSFVTLLGVAIAYLIPKYL